MLHTLLLSLSLAFFTYFPPSTYQVNVSQSTVQWRGTKIIGGRHEGTINIKSGALDISGKQIKGGSFVMDMPTIACTDLEGEAKTNLENHLKSDDFFGVDKSKTSSLTIESAKSLGDGKHEVTAQLMIKGKSGSVTFPTELNVSGKTLKATAKIVIDRSKYDVRYGSDSFFDNLGDKAIDNDFTLTVSLVAKRK